MSRMLTVGPDMAEMLAILTLPKTSLGFVRLSPILIWQRLVSLNTSWMSDGLGKFITKMGRFAVVILSSGN
jgi:hypothetical protein